MGYKPLDRGTKVRFVLDGRMWEGVVKGYELDPNRKPGIARVTYHISYHPAFRDAEIHASKVEVVGETKG